MAVIRAEKLHHSYGTRVGVAGVDLCVESGCVFGFLGPNGAGKTTTIRILLGFLKAQGGTACVFDRDCWGASHVIKRDVGYVPGDLRLYPWMTARNGVRVLGAIRGTDMQAAGNRLCERLTLDPDVSVRKMSRGMRQKLGLLLALAARPRLLVLDEPTSGLDPLMQIELAAIVRECAEHHGTTVFFSSHTLSEVEHLCDRIAIIRAGRIVADEPLSELQARARRQVVLLFGSEGPLDADAVPSFLNVIEHGHHRWTCEMTGPAAELARWVSGQAGIVDFTVGPPDLETVFRSFYRGESEAAGHGGVAS